MIKNALTELTDFSNEADVLELLYNAYRQVTDDMDHVYDHENDQFISNKSVERIINDMKLVQKLLSR